MFFSFFSNDRRLYIELSLLYRGKNGWSRSLSCSSSRVAEGRVTARSLCQAWGDTSERSAIVAQLEI